MVPTVTAGLDGSPESLSAAGWAAREALRRGLPLRLLHAWERQPYPAAHAPLAGRDLQSDWAERVPREAETELRSRHPDLQIIVDQVAQQPAPALLAATADAELLVLGSRGLGGVAGFLVGSVALTVVARARRPVVLVRAGELEEDEHLPDAAGQPSTGTPYRDVVLGIDPGQPAGPVIEFAFDAALRRTAVLRVIHSWNLPVYYGYGAATWGPEFGADLAEQQAGELAEALRPWREKYPGVQVTEQALVGRAAHHLVEAASEAGLLVVGRRAQRPAIGPHVGSVTHAVLHHAAAPVAVVPYD